MRKQHMYNTIAALIATALMAIGLCAISRADSISAPIQGQQGYSSVTAAAAAGLRDAASTSSNTEYAGAVYSVNSWYYYTSPARGEDASFSIKIRIPKGAKLEALYHTHPAIAVPHTFSPRDVQVADGFGVPSFVGDIGTGVMIEYIPHKSQLVTVGAVHGASYGQDTGELL